MIHLDYRDARPIYTQIIDGFREQIAAGVLRPGEKLPSVRDLAAELTINPNTIQRSYRQLELEGWIVSMQGKGKDPRSHHGGCDRLFVGWNRPRQNQFFHSVGSSRTDRIEYVLPQPCNAFSLAKKPHHQKRDQNARV